MNTHTTQRLRKSRSCCLIYRTFMCALALTAIFSGAAITLTEHFSPDNLENMAVESQYLLRLPATLREEEEMDPVSEGDLKDGVYIIKRTEQNKTEDNTAASGDDGVFPISETDLSSGAAQGQVLIRDTDSGLEVDIPTLLHSAYPNDLKTDTFTTVSTHPAPLVLILHTHATESYTEEGDVSYTADTSFRSTDTEKNVVAVGKVMADILNENGIPTLHCTLLHDAEDYTASYDRSLETVKKYLSEYPSIKYVFDVHRDAIIRENGEALKPVCDINGVKTAQVMTLVGTDAGGAEHPDWEENNMNLAVKLQYNLTSDHNGMARPINLRKLSFHQQYAPGSLLFEIGSCANTLTEAKNAAANLAEAIVKTIRNE